MNAGRICAPRPFNAQEGEQREAEMRHRGGISALTVGRSNIAVCAVPREMVGRMANAEQNSAPGCDSARAGPAHAFS